MHGLSKFSLICAFCLICCNAQAGVRFINDIPNNSINSKTDSHMATKIKMDCMSKGYTRTFCPKGQKKVGYCPMSSKYFKECCDIEYRYSKEQCLERGLRPSFSSCGGLYRCR